MKSRYILLLLLVHMNGAATTYYLSARGDDNAKGNSPQTAWKTIERLNRALQYAEPGDSFLFHRGDSFYGSIKLGASGSKKAPLHFGAYGNGKTPVISGFTSVSNWVPAGSGIWMADVPGIMPNVNLVVLNEKVQPVGRYPNSNESNGGYLRYTGTGGSATPSAIASITAEKPLTQNWNGAEVVIKKRRWLLERNPLVAQNAKNIQYRQPGDGNIYPGIPGFGFFIQRHPATLNQPGEWYANAKEKKIQVYFGQYGPQQAIAKISTVDVLLNIGRSANIHISNLHFEGANEAAISSNTTSGCTITQCSFNFMGRYAILNWQTSEATVEHCSINNTLGCGIFIRNSGSGGYNNSTVQYCTVKNTCLIPGMEIPDDAPGRAAITVTGGSNVTIAYNTIDSAGYAGIEWQGNDVLIYGNLVSNCLLVRDDGGGIYTYVGKGPSPKQYSNRIIRKNIVLYCRGTLAGTNEDRYKARGIYCDDGSNNILIDSNSIAYCGGAALYCNSVSNITMRHNTVFNNESAFSIQRYENAPPTRNITIQENIFFPYKAAYSNSQIDRPALSLTADMKAAAKVDNNYYFTSNAVKLPFSFATMKTGGKEYRTFTQPLSYWTNEVGYDKNSKAFSVNQALVKFVYNASRQSKNEKLNGNYTDVYGNRYSNHLPLPPLSAAILIKTE
ncbi:MAG TPA: right-handed parallel beta-helix repeat-containing protein [Ferruginibacter sp.]|nr:right-handed parallel beta-helix repeat-containing protein [Ferruginibacter sp.]HMP20509.1 right-handed parallel beta-helix repeat-containing protein [Ferruginibacter sp.]